MTSDNSGMEERAFPFEFKEAVSLGSGIRFHSGEEDEVRRRLKEDCASFNALYQACRRLIERRG
jgi:hypothetical protein